MNTSGISPPVLRIVKLYLKGSGKLLAAFLKKAPIGIASIYVLLALTNLPGGGTFVDSFLNYDFLLMSLKFAGYIILYLYPFYFGVVFLQRLYWSRKFCKTNRMRMRDLYLLDDKTLEKVWDDNIVL